MLGRIHTIWLCQVLIGSLSLGKDGDINFDFFFLNHCCPIFKVNIFIIENICMIFTELKGKYMHNILTCIDDLRCNREMKTACHQIQLQIHRIQKSNIDEILWISSRNSMTPFELKHFKEIERKKSLMFVFSQYIYVQVFEKTSWHSSWFSLHVGSRTAQIWPVICCLWFLHPR